MTSPSYSTLNNPGVRLSYLACFVQQVRVNHSGSTSSRQHRVSAHWYSSFMLGLTTEANVGPDRAMHAESVSISQYAKSALST